MKNKALLTILTFASMLSFSSNGLAQTANQKLLVQTCVSNIQGGKQTLKVYASPFYGIQTTLIDYTSSVDDFFFRNRKIKVVMISRELRYTHTDSQVTAVITEQPQNSHYYGSNIVVDFEIDPNETDWARIRWDKAKAHMAIGPNKLPMTCKASVFAKELYK